MSEAKKYQCPFCGKIFGSTDELMKHENDVHRNKYTCPHCHKEFKSQQELDAHERKEHSK